MGAKTRNEMVFYWRHSHTLNALCSLSLSKLYAQKPINFSSKWRTLGCTSSGHPDCLAVGGAAAESLTPRAGPPHPHPHPQPQPCPTQSGVKIAPLALILHIGSPLCSCAQESGDVGAVTRRKWLYCPSRCRRYYLKQGPA